MFTDRDGIDISDRIKPRADLRGANLAGADLGLLGADLFGVTGWGTVSGKDTITGLDGARGVPKSPRRFRFGAW